MLNRYFHFIRHHMVVNSVAWVTFMGLIVAVIIYPTILHAESTIISPDGSINPLNVFTSLEFYAGWAIAAPAGYAFAQKTSVMALQARIDRDQPKLDAYEALLRASLDEKLEHAHHE